MVSLRSLKLTSAHVGQSGLTDPGERSANKSRVSPVRCASPVAPPSQQRSNVESRGSSRLRCNCIRKVSPTRKRCPVSYPYSFEDLLALLHGRAPAKVDAVALHRRRVEHGHLSVGLKIHCLGNGSQFSTLVEGLGGTQKILDLTHYNNSHASPPLRLP